jgi:hypothetical protein
VSASATSTACAGVMTAPVSVVVWEPQLDPAVDGPHQHRAAPAAEPGGILGQVAGVYAELAALARDLPRFRLLSTGTWNRAGADVAPQDCWALAAWPGVGEQVEHRMG